MRRIRYISGVQEERIFASLARFGTHLGRPEIKARLGYSHHLHLDPIRQLEIKLAMSDRGILLVLHVLGAIVSFRSPSQISSAQGARGREEKARTTHQLEELALLEEQHGIEMILLDLPELSLEGREGGPGGFGDVERAGVVAFVGGAKFVGLGVEERVGGEEGRRRESRQKRVSERRHVRSETAKAERMKTYVHGVDEEAKDLLVALLRFLLLLLERGGEGRRREVSSARRGQFPEMATSGRRSTQYKEERPQPTSLAKSALVLMLAIPPLPDPELFIAGLALGLRKLDEEEEGFLAGAAALGLGLGLGDSSRSPLMLPSASETRKSSRPSLK
jgi:hypothetical protein